MSFVARQLCGFAEADLDKAAESGTGSSVRDPEAVTFKRIRTLLHHGLDGSRPQPVGLPAGREGLSADVCNFRLSQVRNFRLSVTEQEFHGQ